MAASLTAARGQDAPAEPAATAARQLVARLRAACETEFELRGALLQGDELRDGILSLTGTVDRDEQRRSLEDAARRLLDESPPWKSQIPRGVSAAKLLVFPIRSEFVRRLQEDFARGTGDPAAAPDGTTKSIPPERLELYRQTRIDDLFFDARGRLRFAGLCINETAYLTHKNTDLKPVDDPLTIINQRIRERLKGYPVPEGVDRAVISRLVAEKMQFQENPARRLQKLANESSLDEILFWDADFDSKGDLTIKGLLGSKDQYAAATAFVERPDFVKAYARPDHSPPARGAVAVASMSVAPWQKALLSRLQERFASDAFRKGTSAILRHCRIDRAYFVFAENAALKLRFEGVVLKDKDALVSPLTAALRTETARLFAPPIAITYDAQNGLTVLPNPLRALQTKIASIPELDGVRLDAVVFGPEHEIVLEGLWIGPAQIAALDASILPAVVELTRGKVRGPLTRRLNATPTNRLLRSLRTKVSARPSETSLGRLYFRPAAEAGSRSDLVLQGATLAAGLLEVRNQLAKWLKEDALNKVVGAPIVDITPREKSLVAEIRKLVAGDKALDGVRIDHGAFDEDDTFVLSGRQDHDGQAEEVATLVGKAAAIAWKGLPPPKAARAGAFAVIPLGPMLAMLSRKLPGYAEAEGVALDRAYFNEASELVLSGRLAGAARDTKALKKRVTALLGEDSGVKLGPISLKPQPIDAEACSKIVSRGIDALARGGLQQFDLKELGAAIMLNPRDSSAWYLRGAYYLLAQDRELAIRDLGRAHSLERQYPSLKVDRRISLVRFQGSLRTILEDMLEDTSDPR
jgi:hypothetical protein